MINYQSNLDLEATSGGSQKLLLTSNRTDPLLVWANYINYPIIPKAEWFSGILGGDSHTKLPFNRWPVSGLVAIICPDAKYGRSISKKKHLMDDKCVNPKMAWGTSFQVSFAKLSPKKNPKKNKTPRKEILRTGWLQFVHLEFWWILRRILMNIPPRINRQHLLGLVFSSYRELEITDFAKKSINLSGKWPLRTWWWFRSTDFGDRKVLTLLLYLSTLAHVSFTKM